MSKRVDITGMRFGRLTVLRFSHQEGDSALWKCLCSCGRRKTINSHNLRSRRTLSCGCFQKERASRARKIHGQSNHPLYQRWRRMIDRCENPNNRDYQNYGGRGIKVCKRWHNLTLFLRDMEPTWRPGLTIDRRNVQRGYTPANCGWATQGEQCCNTRRSLIIDTPWGKMNASHAADKIGINRTTFLIRLKSNWPTEKLFSRKLYSRWDN